MSNDFFDELESDLIGEEGSAASQDKRAETPDFSATIEDNYEFTKKPINTNNTASPTATPAIVTNNTASPRIANFNPNQNKNNGENEKISNFNTSFEVPHIFPNLKPQTLPPLEKGHTRIITVGGHNEVGKNLSVMQYNGEIILIDGGLQFPESTMLGAKYCLPDISFLIPLKDKIKGIVITHGHLDHIGGLKHILPTLGFPPIYGAKLTIGLIKKQLEDAQILDKAKLFVMHPEDDGIFNIGLFKVEFFRENHNIPDACGIYIETPNARMVYTGDFKFDFTPSIDKPADLSKIAEIGARGIDLLMSDSTNSLKEGFTQTEADIGVELHKIISESQGRIVIATFASLIGRIHQIIESAEKTGRTVFLNGRSMVENVRIGRELGYIKCNPNTIRRLTNAIDSVPDNKTIILTTGSQGEEFSGLYRMAYGEHPIIKIRPGDNVILSSNPIPGNERGVVNLMNELIKLGASLYTKDGMDIHTSGHASREEQKIMINLVKPKFFMPAHGELFMRVAHKKTAMSLGIPDKNVFLTDNGSIIDIDADRVIRKNKYKLKLEDIIVDGQGIGVATSHIIDARGQMMKAGVVVIVFKADEKSKALLGPLKIETRGLAYLDEVREVHRMIIKKARTSFENTVKDIPDIEEKELIKIVKKDVESYLQYKIEREPMVIPTVVYV
ncbi:MAG: ribonuclease J [Candidatus Gracilibacteria bacterium]|nr:ribonuclease J [Candidatus Gracilibacteria bacterium]MDD2909224.1 ribonuclease J [Candidatus Gracilibacteria bacterium]